MLQLVKVDQAFHDVARNTNKTFSIQQDQTTEVEKLRFYRAILRMLSVRL